MDEVKTIPDSQTVEVKVPEFKFELFRPLKFTYKPEIKAFPIDRFYDNEMSTNVYVVRMFDDNFLDKNVVKVAEGELEWEPYSLKS